MPEKKAEFKKIIDNVERIFTDTAHEEISSRLQTEKGISKEEADEQAGKILSASRGKKGQEQKSKKDEVVETLEKFGGKRWQKGEHDRIYFDAPLLAKEMGYIWSNYKTGNISYAKYKENKISNSEMGRVLDSLRYGKLYYDLNDQHFHWGIGPGIGRQYIEKAVKKLRKQIEVI